MRIRMFVASLSVALGLASGAEADISLTFGTPNSPIALGPSTQMLDIPVYFTPGSDTLLSDFSVSYAITPSGSGQTPLQFAAGSAADDNSYLQPSYVFFGPGNNSGFPQGSSTANSNGYYMTYNGSDFYGDGTQNASLSAGTRYLLTNLALVVPSLANGAVDQYTISLTAGSFNNLITDGMGGLNENPIDFTSTPGTITLSGGVVTAVPEPSSMVLAAVAMGALAFGRLWMARRIRRSSLSDDRA